MSSQIRVRVAAVIIKEEKVLLIRHTKDGKKYWLLPGGGVDYGEDLVTSLKRELSEELSIEIDVRDILHVSDSISPNGDRHIVNIYFICDYISGEIKLGDEERLSGWGIFTAKELKDIVIIPPVKKEIINYMESRSGSVYLGSRWDVLK